MNQADERHTVAGAVPSTGNIEETSPSRFGDRPLGEVERNDVYYALGMIDARAMALRQMVTLVAKSLEEDDDMRGVLDVIAFEVSAIEDLADERMRSGSVH